MKGTIHQYTSIIPSHLHPILKSVPSLVSSLLRTMSSLWILHIVKEEPSRAACMRSEMIKYNECCLLLKKWTRPCLFFFTLLEIWILWLSQCGAHAQLSTEFSVLHTLSYQRSPWFRLHFFQLETLDRWFELLY